MRKHFTALSPVHRNLLGRLAANTRRLREEKGWTQEKVAEECDLSVYTLQCIEAGETSITTATLAALSGGFKVDALEFLRPADFPAKRATGRPRKK